jgi:geranylgeranylglycerol-phosphate geranylgeranyltransferase
MGIKNYLKLTRAEHSFMLAIAVIAGEIITGKFPNLFIFILALIPPILIGMASFAINDYFDINVDKKNKKNDRPLVSGKISPKSAFNLSLLMFVIGVALSAFINIYAFIISLIFAILAFLYSYKLKEMFLIGNIYIAFAMAIPFIYGDYVVSNALNTNILLISLIILLSGLAREIHGMIRDYKGDVTERHSKNLIFYIGTYKSGIVAANLYLYSIILSIFLFFFKFPFYLNLTYLIPIIIIDITLFYVSIVYLRKNISDPTFIKTRNISLAAMTFAILIYLIAPLFPIIL